MVPGPDSNVRAFWLPRQSLDLLPSRPRRTESAFGSLWRRPLHRGGQKGPKLTPPFNLIRES